jgi:predicted extracellular nuclease
MPSFAALPRRLLTGLVTLSLVASFGATAAPARAADGGELFFSEYVEGSSNNKALEIYNPNDNAVDLGGYGVTVYFNGATATVGTRLTLLLSGESIAGKGVYILASSSADPAILAVADQTTGSGLWNGDDAITLVHNGTVIDVIGQIGNDPGSQWGSGDASTQDNTLRRKATVLTGDPNGSDAFDPSVQWDGYPEDTFGGLGSHSTTTGGNQAVSIVCGASVQALEGASESTTITATDPDGIVTDISITSVTPDDAGISITSVTPATENGGDASATLTVADTTAANSYSVNLTATNADTPAQTASCTLSVGVNAVQTIGEVQGQVTDTTDATAQTSAFDGDTVVVRGVVTETTLARTSSGGSSWSFYIQNSLATDDNDPLTSDGIQIFNNRFATIRFSADPRGPQYTPVVGDEIVVSGKVDEYFNMTELASPFIERVLRHGVDLDTELASVEANPSHDLAEAQRFWERHESMRVSVPAGSLVTAPRDVFASTADGEMWVIRGDDPLAQRSDPYARRVFRDFHPLDDVPGIVDNQNGERILLTSHGLKAAAHDNMVLIAPARTFDTVTNELIGAVNFSFDKYGIEIVDQPELENGVDPALNAPPQPVVAGEEYATSDYNVENLYDFRDDPNDGCDFLGNDGCPGVHPPFDYVPLSQADYDQHLSDLAAQIAGPMHAPEILMIQEAEDQDICSVVAGAMSCGTADNADGQPDTLQDLALAVSAIGGPTYLTAYDRDGADDRGIVSAFMYRTDSVELLPVSADDPVLGSSPTVEYRSQALPYNTDVSNPKALNAVLPDDVSGDTDGDNVYTRAPQVGHFRVWRDGIGQSVFTDLYAISNHFSSGPDGRVEQRTEQAAYNAAIVAALQGANPDERVVSAGDFNVFPRPDDPFPNDPSDQLAALYDAGLHNLFDVLVDEVPSSAYSYVFEGQAQTLDQQFATTSLFDELVQIRAAHINADFAADYDGDVARGASDHDPQVARWTTDVTFDRIANLALYFGDSGAIHTQDQALALSDWILRLAALRDAGQERAFERQLANFRQHVETLSPRQIDPTAAAVLLAELDRLIGD